MKPFSRMRRFLSRMITYGHSSGSSASPKTIRSDLTDAGYYEQISLRYSSAQMIAMMLLALFLAVSLLTNASLLSLDNLIYFAKDMTSSISMQEGAASDTLVYTEAQLQRYALFREGLAVLGRDRLTVFTATGRRAYTDYVSFATPRLSSSGRYLAAYDLGGMSYRLYNSFDCVNKATLNTPIRAMATANDGSYCVVTDGEKTVSLVTLYDERFRPLNYYHINEYAVCAALSDDGRIVIGSVSSEQGRMTTHLMLATAKEAEADAVWMVDDAYPVELCFTENGRILLVCTDALIWFDAKGKEVNRQPFSSESVILYRAGEQGAILLSRANGYDASAHLVSFDKNGKRLYDITLDTSVRDVCIGDGTLGVLTDGELLVYRRGKTKPSITVPLQGDYDVLLSCVADEFLLCGASKTVVVRVDDLDADDNGGIK